MAHIREGVKYLTHGLTTDEKENAKNRVARSLDQICKFIDEFEGLRDRSKRASSSAPKLTLHFFNRFGNNHEPKKFELTVSKTMSIGDLKKEICEVIKPPVKDYELMLLAKGKDIGLNDIHTLNDFDFKEEGRVNIEKNSTLDLFDEGIEMTNISLFDEKDVQANADTLKNFGIDCDEEVIKLALRKNKNNIEEALLVLTSDAIEGLKIEVAEKEEQNAYIPIISKEEEEKKDNEEEEKEEEESKLNLIIANRSEYFDLLFDLLNLGVNEINVQAWNLLTQIPVNKKLYSNIKNLNINKKEDWNLLMDPQNMYKLLYSLQIINSLICSPDNESVDESELQERYEWRLKFLQLGGFEHLITILITQNHIEETLKQQRRTRNNRKKNKSDDQGKANSSLHKAGLYMINIIKIFIQASLLANTEDDNLLYSIISQSATSPFVKKSKSIIKQNAPQNTSLNLGSLLVDISDGSKDNSSYNTPNFASPKSNNTQTQTFENTVTFNDDLDVVTRSPSKKNFSKPNKAKASICTQVDDFQKLIDQVNGDVSNKIIETVDFGKLLVKLLSIVYYAVRVTDYTDKNISVMIDSCFDLLLPCIINSPDELIPILYGFNNFESFIVSSLRFKGNETVRKTVFNTFKLI